MSRIIHQGGRLELRHAMPRFVRWLAWLLLLGTVAATWLGHYRLVLSRDVAGGVCVLTVGPPGLDVGVAHEHLSAIARAEAALDLHRRGEEAVQVWQLALNRKDGTRWLVLGEVPDKAAIDERARRVDDFLRAPHVRSLVVSDPDGTNWWLVCLGLFDAAALWVIGGLTSRATIDPARGLLTIEHRSLLGGRRREVPLARVRAIGTRGLLRNTLVLKLDDGSELAVARHALGPLTAGGRRWLHEARQALQAVLTRQ